jgi:hypothetical protein
MVYNIDIMLKPKSIAVLDEIVNNPKISATDAYLKHHKTTNKRTATVNANKLLTKTDAQVYLNKHINKAKNRVVQLIDSDKEEIAFRASEAVMDRALGKATQRIEQQSTSVNLNLDLTSITGVEQ